MTETEKGIMARSIKNGQDQINFIREQQAKENSEPKEVLDDIESHPMKVVKSLEEDK